MSNGPRLNITLAPRDRGGMRSVVDGYISAGITTRHNIDVLWTHDDVDIVGRMLIAGRAYLRFLFILFTQDVGVVHCHVAAHGSFFRKAVFAITARAARRKVILHIHGSMMKEFYEGLPRLLQWFVRWQLEHSTIIIALSESWREFLTRIAPLAHVVVLPNGVDLPVCTSHRTAEPNALCLGLIGERKGSFDLIRAFRFVVDRYPEAHLTLAGNGEVEAAAELVRTLGLQSHVSLPGWVSGGGKSDLLASAAIYVLVSRQEGLPVSIIEAMARGLPVVATPVGGIPELVVDGHSGLLVPPGDIQRIADALMELFADVERRERLGQVGCELVRTRYSIEAVGCQLDRIYEGLMQASDAATKRAKV